MGIFNKNTAGLCKAFPSSVFLCLEKAGALSLASEGCYFSKMRLESLYPLICTSLEKIDAVEVTVLAVEFVKEILPILTDKKNLLFF